MFSISWGDPPVVSTVTASLKLTVTVTLSLALRVLLLRPVLAVMEGAALMVGSALSRVTVLLAATAGLPTRSLTLAVMAKVPLAKALMSAFSVPFSDQALLSTVVVLVNVCGVDVLLSVKVTVTVWPSSAPVVVPLTMKSLSSAALTTLSPAKVLAMVMVGADVSISVGDVLAMDVVAVPLTVLASWTTTW